MNNLRSARLNNGLSLDALANLTGLTRGYLHKLEKYEVVRPSFKSVMTLSRALGVSMQYLMGIQEESGKVSIPDNLASAAGTYGISREDVLELANIKYHGMAPGSPREWLLLHEFLRMLILRC